MRKPVFFGWSIYVNNGAMVKATPEQYNQIRLDQLGRF
jgi:hypothetical protein